MINYNLSAFKIVILITSLQLFLIKSVHSIDCFVCISKNGENKQCEDPFFRNQEVPLHHDCLTGVVNQNGSFRATHCLKLKANGNGMTLVIRTCSLDNGSGLMTEIVRVSHCGYLVLKNFDGLSDAEHLFYGCLSVCNHDGCNNTNILKQNFLLIILLELIILIYF